MISLRRAGGGQRADERILGGDDFVEHVLSGVEEKGKRHLKLIRKKGDFEVILEEECRKASVSVSELKAGCHRRAVSRARALIAKRAMEELGFSMAEIARRVGVSTSGVAKAVANKAQNRNST